MVGQKNVGNPTAASPPASPHLRRAQHSGPSLSSAERGERATTNRADTVIAGTEGGHLSAFFAPRSARRLTAQQYAEALEGVDQRAAGDPAVYIHLPFCPSRCLSCSRVTSVTHDPRVIDCYLDNLDREMAMYADRLGDGIRLAQLHLGGGTPNYLSEPQLLRLMAIVERYFALDGLTEMSLDASPNRCSAAQLQLLAGLGFEAIKFQIRDVDVDVQRGIGRSNSMSILEDVFQSARDADIAALGADLVYGLPEQTATSIARTVDALLMLEPDRISCHAFSRRADEFPHQNALTSTRLPSLADRLILFNAVLDSIDASNFQWVGLDTFVGERDALSVAQQANRLFRNWIGYNLHGGATVLGFGVSAISEIGNACAQNHRSIDDWQAALARDELPVRGGVEQSDTERARRRAVSGLFCNMRLDDPAALSSAQTSIDSLQQQGLIAVEDDGIAVTQAGRILLHHTCSHREREYAWASGW